MRPHKDDKILTDWNGLMIAALPGGAQVFDEPTYRRCAPGDEFYYSIAANQRGQAVASFLGR